MCRRNGQGPAHPCEAEQDVQEIQSIDGDGVGCNGGTPRRNPKRRKAGIKENYRWVLPCFDIKNVEMPYKTTGKPILVAIWATCKLCKFKSPGCRAYGLKTKPGNCPSWTGCVKHVENIHYLLDSKDLEEDLADPRAHWDSLEESKARKRGLRPGIKGKARWTNV